mmetsp:Transcript_97100/g.274470  ORF Transcript_97100/g.274470 Transcript_97100/m.274470 type:complete len:216 (-) Transcript_97100:1008-1655(-)
MACQQWAQLALGKHAPSRGHSPGLHIHFPRSQVAPLEAAQPNMLQLPPVSRQHSGMHTPSTAHSFVAHLQCPWSHCAWRLPSQPKIRHVPPVSSSHCGLHIPFSSHSPSPHSHAQDDSPSTCFFTHFAFRQELQPTRLHVPPVNREQKKPDPTGGGALFQRTNRSSGTLATWSRVSPPWPYMSFWKIGFAVPCDMNWLQWGSTLAPAQSVIRFKW